MKALPQFVSGEMHYARIPPEYWAARLATAYAMGLSAVSTYVFWNLHEARSGHYDFTGGRDVAEFVREAARAGLDVVLRPGPYVCAEWDFGGLPPWLLAGTPVALRTSDASYMQPVACWLRRLGEELAPLQRSRGGPIAAVQLENEYGAFGHDAAYLEALRAALDDAGFGDTPYFTIDQPADLARGCLPDIPAAVTFAPGRAREALDALRALRPGEPLVAGEFWAGWFDHWGEPHQHRDEALQARELEYLLREGASVNIYMLHGGTNFGFTSGANATENAPYRPTTTSYDYLAAIDEAGRPAGTYRAFREIVTRARGIAPRPVPAAPRAIAIPPFELRECAPLAAALHDRIERPQPRRAETLPQSPDYVLYSTVVGCGGTDTLDFGEVHDFAIVLVDGKTAGILDRRFGEASLQATIAAGARLEVLVENCGRINYGASIAGEWKGLDGPVTFAGNVLAGWEMMPVAFDRVDRRRFTPGFHAPPAFFRAEFAVDVPGDTFLDTGSLGKGVVFVNGHNAGRYWNVGPQRSLYVPGTWLRGSNEVVIFETIGLKDPFLEGTAEPIITL